MIDIKGERVKVYNELGYYQGNVKGKPGFGVVYFDNGVIAHVPLKNIKDVYKTKKSKISHTKSEHLVRALQKVKHIKSKKRTRKRTTKRARKSKRMSEVY
jgi:hypothetical protein